MKFYVDCCKSKESDTIYHVLKVDFGYRVASLFKIDKDILCELCDVTPKMIYQMKVGDKFNIGVINPLSK